MPSDHYLVQPRDEDGKWVDESGKPEIVSTIKDAGAALKLAATDYTAEVKLSNDADELIAKAKEALPEIQDFAKSIAQKYNAEVTDNEFLIKSKESIMRKARDKYNSAVFGITDAARTTIIVPKETIDALTNEIKNDSHIIEVDIKKHNTDQMGYSGVNTKYRAKNGLIGEIQVNTPEMIYAKDPAPVVKSIIGEKKYNELNKKFNNNGGKGHLYYEEQRKLKYVPGNIEKVAELQQQSINYYKNFL